MNCAPDAKPIPGMKYAAPLLAALLMACGLLLGALLFLPGLAFPDLSLNRRLRASALFRYAELHEMIVTGAVFAKIRCVLTSHAFRSSPRLAGIIYHHLGKCLLAGTVIFAVIMVVMLSR